MRCNPDVSELELVAWGLRNAYGLGFLPDVRLLATDQGADDRGSRPVGNGPDLLFEVREGAWCGWPDFIDDEPIAAPQYGPERAPAPMFVLANHDELPPPERPLLRFPPHAAAVKFEIAPQGSPWTGQILVALFGDIAPVTARPMTPRGFKVVRVGMKNRQVVDFAVNKIAGPASKLPHKGFERPSHCQFGPDGALYVVD